MSSTVTPPSDFGVFKNVHANAHQFTHFKLMKDRELNSFN